MAIMMAQIPFVAAVSSSPGLPELPDQLGGQDSLQAHKGQIVLVLVTDVRRLRRMRRWSKAMIPLSREIEDLHILRIASLPPGSDIDKVRRFLQDRVPLDVPIFIDAHGHWARAFNLDTGTMNLLIFDRTGTLHQNRSGKFSRDLLAEVIVGLQALSDAGQTNFR